MDAVDKKDCYPVVKLMLSQCVDITHDAIIRSRSHMEMML